MLHAMLWFFFFSASKSYTMSPVLRVAKDLIVKAGGWASQDVVSTVYGASINQQVVCSTHQFDEATCGAKLFYYPLHTLLQPPDSILKLVFPQVLDISNDAAKPNVLDIVDALRHLEQNEVLQLIRLSAHDSMHDPIQSTFFSSTMCCCRMTPEKPRHQANSFCRCSNCWQLPWRRYASICGGVMRWYTNLQGSHNTSFLFFSMALDSRHFQSC
jgi:hypothetical protein